MKKFAVLSFAALAFSGLASASLIPSLDTAPLPNPSGPVLGLFTYNYTLKVSSDEQLNPTATLAQKCPTCASGTYFTIYDIFGFTSAGQPVNWTNSVNLMGITPSSQIVTDNPLLSNVTYFYNGPNAPATQSLTGQDLIIPGFTVMSTSGITVTSTSSYNGTKFGFPTGIDQGNNPVLVAGGGVPEPSSMLLIGGGLVALGLLRRKLVP